MRTRFTGRRTAGATALLALAAGVAFGVGALRTENAKLTAGDAADGDSFGVAVAVSGDTSVVGAFAKNAGLGAAYVFTKTGTAWTQQAQFSSAHFGGDRRFGTAVAIEGDRAIFGIPGGVSAGSAEVFKRTGSVWTEEAELFSPDGAVFDRFGESVAISGDTAVIGASNTGSAKGAARVFRRTGTAWAQEAKLTDPQGATFDYFGRSVGISGDTAVVGDFGKSGEQGVVFVFTRAGTTWTEQAVLAAADAEAGVQFGSAVDISGDTVVAGARYVNSQAGAVYVFTRSGTTWTQQAKLTASDGRSSDRFGVSVAIDGDTAVIGSLGPSGDGIGSPGSAYIFRRTGTTWTQTTKLLATDAANGDAVGISVAVESGTVVAGALGNSSARGAAYVFDLDAPAPPTPGYLLSTKFKAKPNAARPERSTLTASGTLEPGAAAANFDRPATFDIGGFRLDVPAFVRKGRSLIYSAGGITLKLTPQKDGLSHAAFSVKVVGDLTGKVDPAAPIAFNFRNDLYDLDGSVNPAGGARRLVTPGLAVRGATATIKGGGADALKLSLEFATDGVVPGAAEDVTICFGASYTSALIPSASFVRKGDAYVYTAKAPGITKVVVDHAKGTITIAGKGLDLGAFGPGGNVVDVTIVRRSETRSARIQMLLSRTKLSY